MKWVDPFFYGQPSLIWKSLVRPVHQGHRVRLHLGRHRHHPEGGGLRVRPRRSSPASSSGLLLGQNRFLADVLGPYIKSRQRRPAHHPRLDLPGRLRPRHLPEGAARRVLVFFIVFFNAFQGVREVDPNLVANVRVLGASPLQVARHVTIPSA